MRLECPFDVMGIGAVDIVAPRGKLVKTMELGGVEARLLGECARDRLMVGLPVCMLAGRELFESCPLFEHLAIAGDAVAIGITRPWTIASPKPHVASTTISSAPVTGLRVNSTPAASAVTISWMTTPIRTVGLTPIRRR